MSDSPSPPPAPDYAGAAKATAQGNAEQALISQYGSMVNQATPYGTVKYTSQEVGKTKEGNPLNQWTQTVEMSPEQQAIYQKNQAINNQLTDLSKKGLGYVDQAMSAPLQGGNITTSINPNAQHMLGWVSSPNLQMNIDNNANQYQTNLQNNANQIITRLQDPELLRQDTTNALYKANTQYLDPQFQQGQSSLENKLANQGITQGSEAYNNAMLNFNNQKQQAYESARNQAISGGVNAAQGMFGMGLQGGQFTNQALGQQFGQNAQQMQLRNQALGQQFGQNLQAGQFGNQAQLSKFDAGMQNANLFNQRVAQEFQQQLAAGQFGNQAAQQTLAQNQALRQDPINMLNAVRTGSQMQTAQMPQVGVSQPAGLQAVAGPDMLGAVTAQGQYNQGLYNAQQASNSNMMSGAMGMLGKIGSAALPLMMASDRRLKTNIKRIGTHAKGIGLYTWRYIWGLPSVGVMADEVEQVMPEAVVTMPSGFKAVNYAMLNGEN